MAAPLLVNPLKIGVSQKPGAAGKRSVAGSPRDTLIRFSGRTGGHSASKFCVWLMAGG